MAKPADKDHFKVIRRLMIFAGMWRIKSKDSSKFRQKMYSVYSVFIVGGFILFDASIWVDFPIVLRQDITRAMENLGVSIMMLVIVTKIVLTQSKKVTGLLQTLLDHEEVIKSSDQVDQDIYIDMLTYSNRINVFLIVFTYGFTATPLLGLNYINYLNWDKTHPAGNSTEEEIIPLPFITWFPFNTNEHYNTAFLIQTWGIFWGATYNSITQIFFLSIMTFFVTKLKILQHHFRNYHKFTEDTGPSGSVPNEAKLLKVLKGLVQEQQALIDCVENLDDSMRTLLLLEFSINSLQIASLLIQLLTIEPNIITIFTACFLTLTVYQMFLLSWHGNEIKEQSLDLDFALYDSKWYEHTTPVKRCVLIMMIRSQRPLLLNIGPFYPMTTSTAVSTMKAAYSYVTLLRTGLVRKKQTH